MRPMHKILPLLLVGLFLAPAVLDASNPTAQDKENYERLIEILFAGTEDNKKIAKDTLRHMGEVGIKLLKDDCRDVTTVRGAFAWALLKEFTGPTDPESLREFARKGLVNVAKEWSRTYGDKKDKGEKPRRLQQIVSDYVELLTTSPKESDFDVLLKALKYSLISEDARLDYGGEFEIWQKVWTCLGDKVRATKSVRDIRSWQKTVDAHFRYYSQRKAFVDRKTIQQYHTMTLVFIHRMNQIKEEEEFQKMQEK